MHKDTVEPVHVPNQVAVLSVTALAFSHSVFLPSAPEIIDKVYHTIVQEDRENLYYCEISQGFLLAPNCTGMGSFRRWVKIHDNGKKPWYTRGERK
jgi:hypothetical protein